MKRKKRIGIYEYLDSIKVLETGSDEDIIAAKREYIKEYKKNWKRQQRLKSKTCTVTLTTREAATLSELAKKYHRTLAAYIKACALAYQEKYQFVMPDVLAVNSIRELLTMNYSLLKRLCEGDIYYETGRTLLAQFDELERRVLHELCHPESLEKRIEDTLRQYPGYKEVVIATIKHIND